MSPSTRGPHVSVVLSSCTSADGIPAALESILHQTYQNLELILVDDGSADILPGIPDECADPRVVVITSPGPSGIARAWNAGIRAARGDLVGFITSGDTWDERKLEEQVAAFARLSPEYGIVYCDSWEITPAGNRAYRHAPDMSASELLNPYATGFQAGCLDTGPLLVRRSVLDQAGPFDEQLRCFTDTDMIIRLQRLCRFHLIHKPLYHRRSGQAPAENPFERSIAQLRLLQKYPEVLENPLFVSHQLDVIRRNLRQVREGCPVVTGRVAQEPEHGQYREPIPYL